MIVNYNSPTRGGNARIGKNVEDVGGPPPWQSSRVMRSWLMGLILVTFVLTGGHLFAQTNVASYSRTVATGATYIPITGGTTFAGVGYDNEVSTAITMGGTFPFGGSNFTTCYISANGFITFGAAPSATNYTPMSSLGSTTGAISAFGQDAGASTVSGAVPSISYVNTGTEFVVQYADHANYYNRTVERLNFQIRLTYATGEINIVYGSCTAPGTVSATGTTVQVGIRGNSVAYATNVNNLMAGNIPTGTTCDWSSAVTGQANSSTLLFYGTTNANVKIPSGMKITFTPGSVLPVRTFAAVSAITASGATLSWTAPTGATQYNVQYRTPGSCTWTNWSGNPVSTNTLALTGLSQLTAYQYRVQAATATASSQWSHIPNAAGTGDGYTATGSFTTLSSCASPTAPTASATSPTAATLTWTAASSAPSGGYDYYVSTSSTAPTASTTPTGNVASGTTASLTALSSGTTYYTWVRGNCGTDKSSWVAASSFTTPYSVPYSEPFATTSLPNGWTNTSSWSIGTARGATGNTGNNIYINLYSGTQSASFQTGNIGTVPANQQLSFDYKFSNYDTPYAAPASGAGSFAVQVSTNNGTSWTTLETISYTGATGYQNKGISLSSVVGQTVKFRINATWAAGDYDLSFDNFRVATIPTCFAPTGLAITGFTATTASAAWVAPTQGTPTNYQYEIRTSGAAGSGATGLAQTNSVTGTSNTFVGLTPSTSYVLYIRSFCGGTDYSAWAAGAAFSTPCTSVDLPYTENFESVTVPALPTCTSIQNLGSGNNWVTASPAAYGFTSKALRYTYNDTYAANVWWYTRGLNLTANVTYTLSYRYGAAGFAEKLKVAYGQSPAATSMTVTLADHTVSTSVSNSNAITFTPATTGVYYFGFQAHSDADEFYLHLDDVSVIVTPPTITSFAPTAICNGGTVAERTVVITGTRFTGATGVTFNGTAAASFTVDSATQITAVVPANATTGVITVTIPAATGSSATSLTVNASPVVSPIQNGNATLCVGGTQQLSDASPGGTWSSSDAAVASVDASGLVTAHAGGTAVISYSVTDLGCTTKVNTSINVNSPIVSTNPAAQTVVTGQNATFSVTATGSVTGYQWMVSTDGGDTFENVVDGAPYSGATTNTLTITATPDYLNENMYMVVVSAAAPCQAFESGAAALNVGDTGISQDPSSVTLCSTGAGTATFTVVASGTVSSYAWQVDSGLGYQNVTDGTFGNLTYSGATTASLTVSGITLANSGLNFRVVVEGPANGATSNPATLTVNQGVSIATAPSSASTCYSGGTATFAVSASGSTTGYQWQYSADGTTYGNVVNGTPAGATYANAATATLSVTTTSATPATGTYFYRAVVSGLAPCGSATSAGAQLIINNPTVAAPTATTVVAGSSATFTANTSASSPTYQWQYSTALASGYANIVDNTPAGITYSGATSATLTVNASSSAVASTARYYRVIVTSAGCSVTSTGGQLTVQNYCTPAATSSSSSISNFVTTGGVTNISNTSTFTTGGYANYSNLSASQYQGATVNFATTTGAGVGTAIWVDFNNNLSFETTERVYSTAAYGSNAAGSFVIPASTPAGNYRMRVMIDWNSQSPTTPCAFVSGRGEAEDYTLTVLTVPACTGTPVAGTATASPNLICTSGSTTLSVTGYSANVSGLTFQWYSTGGGLISGATATTFTTPVLTASESYFVRVTCAGSGSFADSNTVAVTVANPAVTSTTAATRCGTGTVTLGATATSGATVNWYTAATGGTLVATGNSFTTPSLSATTTYYAEAAQGSAGSAGSNLSATSNNGTSVGSHGVAITTTLPNIRINSINIPFTGTGTITFALKDVSNTTTITSFTSGTVTGNGVTPVSVPVNLTVAASGNYLLIVSAITGTVGSLGYATGTYPYTALSGAFSITGGYWYSSDTSLMYIFGVNVSTGCISSRLPVTATVNAAPALTLSSASASICAGASTSAVTLTSNASDYSNYVWTPAAGVSGSAATGWTFNPTATTTYSLSATQASGSQCFNSATFAVTVNALPQVYAVSPASQTVCNGTIQTLSVTIPAVTGVFGAGTTAPTATSYPNPLSSYYGGSKHQMLFTASELAAQGLVSGSKISAVTFYLNNSSGGALTDFTIRMGNTANTALNGFVSGTSTVYGPNTFTPSANGLVTFALTTPYTWNGSSNLVVETVYNGGNSGNGSGTRTRATTTTNNSVYYGASDSVSGGISGFDALTSYGTSGASTSRPNMTFLYNTSPTWTPTTGLYTDAAATVAYTGGNVATVYAKPVVSTTYTATYTSSAGCTATSTSTITVNQYHNFYVDADGDHYGTGAPVSLCAASATAAPTGYATVAGDCDDTLAAVNPGHAEVLYNGIDDNCDGNLDEGHQLLSSVLPSQCGTTLASISSYVGAVSFSAPVDGYRFKVVNTTTNAVQVYDSPYPHFQFSQLASYEYAKTYSISVMVRRNGVWLGYYGPSCLVSTPAILDAGGAASVSPSQCGGTLASISTLIATTSIPNVTGYRFRVTNLVDGGDYATQVIERTTNWFSLTLLTRYNYGTEYTVEVAVKSNAGVWSGYGSPCSVSSPALPMLSNCGATVATAGTLVSVTSKDRAQAYRFEITNMNTFAQITVDRATNYFSFNNVPGYASGAQYAVRVAIQTSGYWSPFGEACTITAPGAARTIVKDDNEEAQAAVDFRAIAYPNPYVQSFGFQMETSSDEKVQVKIYDMVGKLLDEREFAVDQVEKQQFGDRYPSGVYNIVVTQAGFVKTLRVIKR